MNLQDAIGVIESVPGFTDETTPVGEAWAAVLASLSPTPVPVFERLPGPEDCDAEGRCWAWCVYDPEVDDIGDYWMLVPFEWLGERCRWTHWLPATALPLPAGEV